MKGGDIFLCPAQGANEVLIGVGKSFLNFFLRYFHLRRHDAVKLLRILLQRRISLLPDGFYDLRDNGSYFPIHFAAAGTQ